MKKTLLFLFVLFICNVNTFSQNTENKLSLYLQNYQYQQALDYIATQEPTKELLLQKALCYKALGMQKNSVEILQPLSDEYHKDIKIRTELALCYEAIGKRDESIACYDSLMVMDSTNVYFAMQKAELLYQQEKFKDALILYQNIYDDKGFLNCLKRSAQCFEKINEPDSAKHYYSIAWEKDSTDSFSAANLINLNLKTEHYGNAILLSDIYVQRDSTDKQINVLNALSYYFSDLYEEAIERFKKCHEAGDTSLVVNRSLGIALYSMKESYDAQPFLEAAYRQDTTNNNVLYCLAIVCNDMGEHKKSIPHFHRLLDRTIPPDLTLYLYYRNLGLAYWKGKREQEAVDTYTKALAYANDDQKMNLYYTIADLSEHSLNKKTEALEYFRLYKVSLIAYMGRLREKLAKEPDDTDYQKGIKETEEKLKHLNTYIVDLEKEIAKT